MQGLCRVLCIVCIVFCFPLLFTYSVGLKRGYVKPYTAAVSLQNRVGLNAGHADQTLHTKPPLKDSFLKGLKRFLSVFRMAFQIKH